MLTNTLNIVVTVPLLIFFQWDQVQAFQYQKNIIQSSHGISRKAHALQELHATKIVDSSKRESVKKAFGIIIGTALSISQPAHAAVSTAQMDKDKEKIVKGYKRLTYLLDNWEKETTVCRRNDNPYLGCDRTPEKVMEYLGYKSMEDPLFRADKTLIRLQALVPDEESARYQDAVDTWLEKAEEGNGMAFVSSWGEANPGGGKDRVELFIERSKMDVIEARETLATVISILGLKVN